MSDARRASGKRERERYSLDKQTEEFVHRRMGGGGGENQGK